MNKLGNFFKPLTWFMALLLAGLVAGCGGDDGGGVLPVPPPSASAAGAVCTGPDCVDLGTAGEFVILTQTGITDVPTSPITGNVGSSAITGAAILVTCAEVTGSIYAVDAAGPAPCTIVDGPKLTQAVSDMQTAYTTATGLPADVTPGGNTINTADCAGALPGVYRFPAGAVTIQSDCTLTGSATDVWIFHIQGTLNQDTNTNLILAGGALPQNVFWVVDTNVAIGAGAHLEGVVLATTDIALVTGASLTGRLYSGTEVALDQNTVTRP